MFSDEVHEYIGYRCLPEDSLDNYLLTHQLQQPHQTPQQSNYARVVQPPTVRREEHYQAPTASAGVPSVSWPKTKVAYAPAPPPPPMSDTDPVVVSIISTYDIIRASTKDAVELMEDKLIFPIG